MWLEGWGGFLAELCVCREAVPPKLNQYVCAHSTVSPRFVCVRGGGVGNLCSGWHVSVSGFL